MNNCNHNYVYKIMFNHDAADVCTKCGNIKLQNSRPAPPPKPPAKGRDLIFGKQNLKIERLERLNKLLLKEKSRLIAIIRKLKGGKEGLKELPESFHQYKEEE